MNKWIGKIKLIWFFIKTIFATDVEFHRSNKDNRKGTLNWNKYLGTVQDFLDKYNVDYEDKVDYTNTHKHHHDNFNHLDDPNNPEFKDDSGRERVLEQVGLVYEEDGKTPRNPAEVFDMTYEEYENYKKKILPRAETKKITYTQIKNFINKERGIKPKRRAPKKTTQGDGQVKKRRYKPRKPKASNQRVSNKKG